MQDEADNQKTQAGDTTIVVAPPTTIASGYCTPILIRSQTSDGSDAPTTQDQSVVLSDNVGGTFYDSAACDQEISDSTLLAGETSKMVYYQATLGGGHITSIELSFQAGANESTNVVELRAPIYTLGVGSTHTCFGVGGQEIFCGGYVTRGAVGLTGGAHSRIAENPNLLSLPVTGAVTTITSGTEFSCAILDGDVYCWGFNNMGQLGNSLTINESAVPLQVGGLGTPVTSLSAGNTHTCAVANGGAWCWGDNGDGRLGANVGSRSEVPVQVDGLSTGVRSIAAGHRHSCALLDTGEVRCWGLNFQGQLGRGSIDAGGYIPQAVIGIGPASQLDVRGSVSCAVVDSRVWCWGDNDSGQLGSGTFTASEHTPQQTVGPPAVDHLVVGGGHSCVIASNELWCWGDNRSGVLANGTRDDSATPVRIPLPEGTIETLDANGGTTTRDSQMTCVTIDGLGYCWGATNGFPDGVFKETWQPAQTTITGNISALAAGSLAQTGACALIDGDLRCWGRDWGGRLGQMAARDSSIPVNVEGLTSGSGVTDFALGFLGGCAVVNGAARCWGRGSYLGNGTSFSNNSEVPVEPTGLSANVSAVSAGNSIVCAVVDGGAMCWGLDGALGNGPANDGDESLVPVWVTGMGPSSGVTDIAVGNHHACAVQNGGAYCWGTNGSGELGDGNPGVNSNVPVPVTGLSSGVAEIEAGDRGVCARMDTGAVYCWGTLIPPPQDQPILIPGLGQDVSAISLAGFSGCAIQLGELKCWGSNGKGQLGTGDLQSSDVPLTVSGLPGPVERVAVGGVSYRGFTCAVAAGDLYCWGDNSDRQLATGLPFSQENPVLIAPWE